MNGLDDVRRFSSEKIIADDSHGQRLRRLEWNGVSGWREVEIERAPDEDGAEGRITRHEHLLGEVAEPLS